MKKILLILSLFISLSAYSQTAEVCFTKGLEKQNAKDYKGAIEEYNKAIELNPSFAKAYYNRATVFASMEKYEDAIPDLNKVIELYPTLTAALTLRGQLKVAQGKTKEACEDFNRAKQLGNDKANKFLEQYCGGPPTGEQMVLSWPKSEDWVEGSHQDDGKTTLIELIHSNETLEKWTEMGNMMRTRGMTNIPIDTVMSIMYNQMKGNAPKAKLTVIEKDDKAEFPFVIFIIEAPAYINDNTPESQLWCVVQGKQNLFTNFWAVKKATISPEMRARWVAFFKTGKVVTTN